MYYTFTLSLRTFDQSDGALDTWDIHSHNLANQMKPQVAVGYSQIN